MATEKRCDEVVLESSDHSLRFVGPMLVGGDVFPVDVKLIEGPFEQS